MQKLTFNLVSLCNFWKLQFRSSKKRSGSTNILSMLTCIQCSIPFIRLLSVTFSVSIFLLQSPTLQSKRGLQVSKKVRKKVRNSRSLMQLIAVLSSCCDVISLVFVLFLFFFLCCFRFVFFSYYLEINR